jgi:HD-like signal output (HDOD) protein
MPMATDGNLERRVADLIESLPPMPANLDRLLLAAVRHEGNQAVRRLVRDDPGLCFELLHLANSSCFAGGGAVETIADAVDRVGIEPLAQMVGVRYVQQVIEEHFAPMADLQRYFDHSRDISACCLILAQVTGLDPHRREMYRVAGLIHDIGRLVIMLSADRGSEALMGTSWDRMSMVVDDERKLLGMDHSMVGAELCGKWRFSPTLYEGVLRHHTPLLEEDFSHPGAIIFVAHFVSLSDFTGQTLTRMLPPVVLEKLGLTAELFDQARARCRGPRAGT